MLKTLLGEIEITVNNQDFDYLPIQLDNQEQNFLVDGRYKIVVYIKDILETQSQEIFVKAKLIKNSDDNIQQYVESGERLAMLSFYSNNKKLSIGVEDEIIGTLCTYEKDSVKVLISPEANLSEIVFGIAWISMRDTETQDIYTWFAADPTLYKAYENNKKES